MDPFDEVLECETPEVFAVIPYKALLLPPQKLKFMTPQQLERFWLEGWVTDITNKQMYHNRNLRDAVILPSSDARLCFDLTPVRIMDTGKEDWRLH